MKIELSYSFIAAVSVTFLLPCQIFKY